MIRSMYLSYDGCALEKPMQLLQARHDMQPLSKHSGFSLIELMITVAIIGILAAFAYPNYIEHVTNSRRSDGHLAMLAAAQKMERCKATNYSYAGCTLTSDTSPEEYYGMTVNTTATGFTITATAAGAQANDTDCSVMTLNHQSVRTPTTGCWPQ